GWTILHLAVEYNHVATVKVLLYHHFNLHVKDYLKTTPLMISNGECARLLVENGADINDRDYKGHTPLMFLHDVKTSQLLLDNMADLNAQDQDGKTALIYAILNNADIAKVRLFLNYGAVVSLKDREGKTAIDYARDINLHDFSISHQIKTD